MMSTIYVPPHKRDGVGAMAAPQALQSASHSASDSGALAKAKWIKDNAPPHASPELLAKYDLKCDLGGLCHTSVDDDAAKAKALMSRLSPSQVKEAINLSRNGTLFLACHYGRPNIARVLCEYGADVNQQSDKIKRNFPVHYVAGHLPDVDEAELVDIDVRRAKCVEVIAEFGADVNVPTGNGRNYPIHKAAYLRLEQTMLALVRAGADITATNGYGGETAEIVYKNACERAGEPVNEAFLAELAELASANVLPGYAGAHGMEK